MEEGNSVIKACSPQAHWSVRIDNVNPCGTVLGSHHQPIRIMHNPTVFSVTPLPHLAFRNAFLKPIRGFKFSKHYLSPTPWLMPYNKHCT